MYSPTLRADEIHIKNMDQAKVVTLDLKTGSSTVLNPPVPAEMAQGQNVGVLDTPASLESLLHWSTLLSPRLLQHPQIHGKVGNMRSDLFCFDTVICWSLFLLPSQ